MEEFGYATNPALLSNLDSLAREYSIIGEQRLLELSDLAREAANASRGLFADGLSAYDALSAISSSVDFGAYRLSELNSEDAPLLLGTSLGVLSMMDKAVFSVLYISHLIADGTRLSEKDFLFESARDETFTYVRNPFSDEAYEVFSQDFSDPKLRYSSSFKECVSTLDNGEASFCLLPLEEKGGVRLPTVSELIYRNDLKINSVTPVFGPDGSADMKYALVSKSFTVPDRKKGDDRYLELRLGAGGTRSLQELLLALDYFSMSVYRISTVSFENEGESDTYCSLVVRDGKEGFVTLFAYLTLFCEDFVPVGIYKNLE